MLPLALAVVFITGFGILLAQELGDPILLTVIPAASIVAGLIAVILVNRALTRKRILSYEPR
jgi:hypothetical protein